MCLIFATDYDVYAQGYWEEGASWWPGTAEAILPSGELEIRLDATPLYREVRFYCSLIVLTTQALHSLRLPPCTCKTVLGVLDCNLA